MQPFRTASVNSDSCAPQILACAPELCLPYGCPKYRFNDVGLQGCGIDSAAAAVGSMFQVNFSIFDNHVPPLFSSVSRIVTVVTPCGTGEELCDDGSCSDIACDQRDQLGAAAIVAGPPKLMLNPMLFGNNMTLGAGQNVSLSLLHSKVGKSSSLIQATSLQCNISCLTRTCRDALLTCNDCRLIDVALSQVLL